MGWASNYAQMFTLIEGIDKAAKGKEGEVKLTDEFWGQELPEPAPQRRGQGEGRPARTR